jgi:hypothetical protein
MIVVVMVLILVAFFAAFTLSRVRSGGDERDDTVKRLAFAASALERFAAAQWLLAVPGKPRVGNGTGGSVVGEEMCARRRWHAALGLTGLNSDAGLDGWGRKISYRVYTGPAAERAASRSRAA